MIIVLYHIFIFSHENSSAEDANVYGNMGVEDLEASLSHPIWSGKQFTIWRWNYNYPFHVMGVRDTTPSDLENPCKHSDLPLKLRSLIFFFNGVYLVVNV